jgi:hypothetical protein
MCDCISSPAPCVTPATTYQHAPAGCTGGRPPDRLGCSCGCRSSGTERSDVSGEPQGPYNIIISPLIHAHAAISANLCSCRHAHDCLCVHAVLQALARMHGPRSEACVGLQSLQQFFASSPSHAAKRNDAADQAQPAGDVDSAQAAAGQQQPADGAEQSANGAAAPQEPPTVEGLQAELNTQREASEGHAAEVRTQPSSCIAGQPFNCRWSNTCSAGACSARSLTHDDDVPDDVTCMSVGGRHEGQAPAGVGGDGESA